MSLASPARLAQVSGAFVVSGEADVSVVMDGRLLASCLGGERGHTEVEAVVQSPPPTSSMSPGGAARSMQLAQYATAAVCGSSIAA